MRAVHHRSHNNHHYHYLSLLKFLQILNVVYKTYLRARVISSPVRLDRWMVCACDGIPILRLHLHIQILVPHLTARPKRGFRFNWDSNALNSVRSNEEKKKPVYIRIWWCLLTSMMLMRCVMSTTIYYFYENLYTWSQNYILKLITAHKSICLLTDEKKGVQANGELTKKIN